jgi:predicted tellurium resistance membrane protein TerC
MTWMNWISDPAIWIGFFTLFLLEVVLGIDNIVFISILTGKLPEDQRPRAWKTGLLLALFMRIGLLLSISWITNLKYALFTLPFAFPGAHIEGYENQTPMSGKALVLLAGGLFLIYKSVKEIHDKLEGGHHEVAEAKAGQFTAVIAQILVIDLVFSLDSVITAVGMVKEVGVMIAAVIASMLVMLKFAQKIGEFVNKHPSIKMLALSFLVMIGTMLISESVGAHVEKGYIYFAMAFSLLVEMLNLRLRAKTPVKLHEPYEDEAKK